MAIARRELLGSFAGCAALAATAAAPPSSAAEVAEASFLPRGAESRFADVGGVRLHYVVAGSGPAVVLLHGWPETSSAWRGTMERLAGRFTLIAPDLRGTGRSDKPASGYDKKTIAQDISRLIEIEASGRAAVVGHDMGGKAAYLLALLTPERVARLVLVDCLIPGTENMDALRGGAWHYGFHMARDIPEMLTRGRERDYIATQIRAWSHVEDAIGDDLLSEYARRYATPGGMTAGFNLYRALPEDARLAASLKDRKLAMPVMTIAGRHSVGTKLSDAVALQADDLKSVIAEGSGHFVAHEAPDLFCDSLERFISA